LKVQPGSPGEKAGLVSYFDFIVAAEGVVLDKEDGRFVQILKTNINKQIKLVIFNRKTELIREAFMTPSDSWGGNGLAGLSIRFCSFDQATENVWHVLDIYQNSPASAAGLQPRTDYIVGSPEVILNDQEDFFTMVEVYEKKSKPLPLYVYSTNIDSIRVIHITPNRNWGGIGTLGCDIGVGYLHRIPLNRNLPSSTTNQQQQLQQLQMQYPPVQSPPGFAVQTQQPVSPTQEDHSHSHSHGHAHSHGHPHPQPQPQPQPQPTVVPQTNTYIDPSNFSQQQPINPPTIQRPVVTEQPKAFETQPHQENK